MRTRVPELPVNAPAPTDDSSHVRSTATSPSPSLTEGLWYCTAPTPIATSLPVDEQVERMLHEGRFTDCNDTMARMYGLSAAQDLIGRPLADFLIPTDPRNIEYLRAFVLSGYRLDGVESVERAADGSTRYFVNHLVGIVRDGFLTGAWGTQADVTHRLRLEQQARQAETITALNRLAGGVAHDFNNLLTTILTSIDMLEETLEAQHVGRQDAAEIRRAARRGAELTRQLLALSQQQVLVPRPGDLNLVVRRAAITMRRSLRPDFEVRTQFSGQPAIANVDGEELEQVLMTLASFAADSVERGGHLEVVVGTATLQEGVAGTPDSVAPGSYVTITLTDDAPAFPEGTIAHLFEPFFGVELSGSASGLALATLRGFVRQSGGSVVVSTPATGRRITIYFPATAASSGGEGSRDGSLTPSSGTVLLAEDEPTVRLLMKRVLQRAGFVVLVASNGEEALDLARSYQHHIDVLVTDVIMPGMGGGELSRRLRQERPGIKVLHVSGYTAGALRQSEALEDGAAFMQKPFTTKALVARLREVMAS